MLNRQNHTHTHLLEGEYTLHAPPAPRSALCGRLDTSSLMSHQPCSAVRNTHTHTHLPEGEYTPRAPPAPRSALCGRLDTGEYAREGVEAAERWGVRLRLLPGEDRARSSSMRSRSRLARTYLQCVCVCVCVCVYLQRRHVFAKERWGGRGCVPQSFTVRVLYIMYYICFYMYYICFYMLLLYMSACVRALARGLRFEVVKCLM
jgi:hypothetical protein